MKTNQAGLDLIKEFEGWRANAYLCPAKVWTIGYGHTSAAGSPRVTKGMAISKAEGESILKQDLGKYEAGVVNAIGQNAMARVNENQFSACVSLCYNIGPGAFRKSSVAKRIRAGEMDKAAANFLLWNKATVNGKRKVLKGLTRRREAEKALFETPVRKTTPKRDRKPPTTGEKITGAGAAGAGVVTAVVEPSWVAPVLAISLVFFCGFVGFMIWRRRK